MMLARTEAAERTEHRASRRHHGTPWGGRDGGRGLSRTQRGGGTYREVVTLTVEGFPAATPGSPPPSPVVLVLEESRARHPWLPRRVIAGSVWHGPRNERVRVDEHGVARAWRRGPAQVRDGSWREVVDRVGVRR
jgi:hypothetical protein